MNNMQNLAVKGIISELSGGDRLRVQNCYDQIMNIILRNGNAGTLAISLIGSELMGDDDDD